VGRPGLLIKIVLPMVVVKVGALLVAAQYGLNEMAATLFGLSVAFAAVRLTVANRLLGISAATSLRAMAPGAAAAVGAAAGALPIVLLRPPEAETLLMAVPAGVIGAGLVLFVCCRPVLRDLQRLVATMRTPKDAR
jgi:PST family polysaccharide transporter